MRVRTYLPVPLALCALLAPGELRCQMRGMGAGGNTNPNPTDSNLPGTFVAPDIEISLHRSDGKPIDAEVLVQLIAPGGQLFDQATAKKGKVRFNRVAKSQYRVLVVAPGYRKAESMVDVSNGTNFATVELQLVPMDAEDAASDKRMSALNQKAQREVGKALGDLHDQRPGDALDHLKAAQKWAPNSADVEYLFGIYSIQVKKPDEALDHWNKALAIDPSHLSSLLEVGQQLVLQKKAAEAVVYLNRALAIEPTAWRAHALLAEAAYAQGNSEEAVSQAQRALDLGHERAASIRPFLAGVLAESGNKDRAIEILQEYLKTNPRDTTAAEQLAAWTNPKPSRTSDLSPVNTLTNVSPAMTAFPAPSNWMPADIDEKIPPVESAASCPLNDLLQKTGEQLVTLVRDADRYTATESVVDQSINKWGAPSAPKSRKFGYVVSMQEIRPGILNVDEYRDSGSASNEFPDGVITNGLPALVMIFHPFYAGNYEMTCEGLAQLNSGLAWQIHFRQRADKPVRNRGYRIGALGQLYPAPLRGRAWISAESNDIVRLETDLVHPIPEIRLVAEHTAIEYSSVSFRDGSLTLWLPQTAEVYFDWRGQRVHRRHSFDNYLLFSIDEDQRISAPKVPKPPPAPASAGRAEASPIS
jgi:tetratricopeptide (TPR) repeat protein